MSRDDYEQYPDEGTEHDPNAPDPEALKRVTSLFPLLDDLRARFEEPTEIVEGSELAGDDVDGPWPRVSEVAVGSMAAAHDHLLASKLHVDVRRQFVVADVWETHKTLSSFGLKDVERRDNGQMPDGQADHGHLHAIKVLIEGLEQPAVTTVIDTLRRENA